MKHSRVNRATRRNSRASRQNQRKDRKSRKYQGGFVRGTSPILNARAFSGTGVWGAQGTPSIPTAKPMVSAPAGSLARAVLPVGPNGYRPFATSVQSTYKPFAMARLTR